MKKLLATLIFITSIYSNALQAQMCVPAAELGYKDVYALVEKANTAGNVGHYETEKKHAQEAVDLTLKLQKKYNCFSPGAFWKLSEAYTHIGDYQAALKNATKAYQLCETFKFSECWNLSISAMKIGNIHLAMGNDSLAMIEYQNGLDICRNGNKVVQAFLLLSLGDVASEKGNNTEAMKNISEAESIAHLIGDKYDISQVILGRCYCSTGIILLRQGNCDEALAKFLAALQLSESVFDRKIISTCYYNVARIYDIKGRYSDALTNYSDAVKVSLQMGYNDIVANSYIYMAQINFCQGQREAAMKYVSDELDLAKKVGYKKVLLTLIMLKGFFKEVLVFTMTC